jgi:formate/nitrite transporter FocA (FNT family)
MPDGFSPGANRGICFDCYEASGFPFTMHEYGTIAHLDQYVWSGVVANLTVALVGSFLLGVLFNFLGQFFTSRRNNLP